jgi:hypothetical protein
MLDRPRKSRRDAAHFPAEPRTLESGPRLISTAPSRSRLRFRAEPRPRGSGGYRRVCSALNPMRETDLISLIQRLNATAAPGLVKGIGDDCAIIRPKAGEDILVTTDFLLEGVHFLRETHTAADCGWKCLARGLSDIAAMGGAPRYAFVSLALAPWSCGHWVRDFYTGMQRLARRSQRRDRRRRPHEVGQSPLRHHRARRGETRAGAVPRRREARRQALRHGTAWVDRLWAWKRARARPGNGICGPSRASRRA